MHQINNPTAQMVLGFLSPKGVKETNFSGYTRVSALAIGTITILVGVLALCGILGALGTVGGGIFVGVGGAVFLLAIGIIQVEVKSGTEESTVSPSETGPLAITAPSIPSIEDNRVEAEEHKSPNSALKYLEENKAANEVGYPSARVEDIDFSVSTIKQPDQQQLRQSKRVRIPPKRLSYGPGFRQINV